jgi:hypothetical protein
MNTKLKMDLLAGVLEVEGNEDFVKQVYDDFKANLTENKSSAAQPHNEDKADGSQKKVKPNKTPAANNTFSKIKAKKVPGLLKNLDLTGGSDKPSLRDFYARYDHKSNFERNLIFTYYLKEELEIEKVTLDHIFTCYRHVGQKIPKALEQGMRDTAKAKAWVDIDDIDDIKVPIAGMNHIEHDLAKSKAE